MRSPALKETLQQLILSTAAAVFAFHWFLYGYCVLIRPRQPVPESGMEYLFKIKGRLIYVTSFEALFLNSFFHWFAVVFVVLIIARSTVGYGLRYDVHQGKVVRARLEEQVNWRRTGVLVGLWLSLLILGWHVSS